MHVQENLHVAVDEHETADVKLAALV